MPSNKNEKSKVAAIIPLQSNTDNTSKASVPFSFGSTASGNDTINNNKTTSLPPFSFPPANSLSIFPSANTTTNTAPATDSKNLFSFTPSSGLFNFPMPGATSTFGLEPTKQETHTNEDSGDEGEEILEPEKILKNDSDTDIILHEAPCKLFRHDKEDNEWKDAGKGTFKITKESDSHKQRILIRDGMGKLALNCYFYKGMKFDKTANSIKFLAPVGEKGELKMLLIKLKPEDVEKTLEALNKGVNSLS